MATIKSFTDISQSKKLAEILPLESADMLYYCSKKSNTLIREEPFIRSFKETNTFSYVPCWSLAALLSVLPMIDFTTPQLIGTPKTLYRCLYNDNLKSHAYDNPVDACYEMIIKLQGLKML